MTWEEEEMNLGGSWTCGAAGTEPPPPPGHHTGAGKTKPPPPAHPDENESTREVAAAAADEIGSKREVAAAGRPTSLGRENFFSIFLYIYIFICYFRTAHPVR